MSNRWNIPQWLEEEVLRRDQVCVYCRAEFLLEPRGRRASWEHIVNDARIVTRENIARCCMSCNASKGRKSLEEWLALPYCRTRGIDAKTVAPVVQAALSLYAEDLKVEANEQAPPKRG
jgi:hypothetical protein